MNTTFINEGTLREELLQKFSITHGDMNENNIELKINFYNKIAKILCSKTLSDIIRKYNQTNNGVSQKEAII